MTEAFKGFSPDFFAFFEELAAANTREWFQANKPRFTGGVQYELSDFVAAMAPRLSRISKHYLADPRPNGKTIFRIYRDVRFSKDKRPYKEHAACHFRHSGTGDAHGPGYYFHLEPKEVIFGGGIWKPAPADLTKIRAAIARDPKAWSKVVGNPQLTATFGGVSGDGLKRAPKGYAPDHPHIEDLKRKTFFVIRRAPAALARGPEILDQVETGFRAAVPLMRFLSKALGAPF